MLHSNNLAPEQRKIVKDALSNSCHSAVVQTTLDAYKTRGGVAAAAAFCTAYNKAEAPYTESRAKKEMVEMKFTKGCQNVADVEEAMYEIYYSRRSEIYTLEAS